MDEFSTAHVQSQDTIQQEMSQQNVHEDLNVDASLVQVVEMYSQGRFFEANNLLKQCYATLPRDDARIGTILAMLGSISAEMHDHFSAKQYYKRSIDHNIKLGIFDPSPYRTLIGILAWEGNMNDVCKYLAILQKRDPTNQAETYINLLPTLVAQGHYHAALAIFKLCSIPKTHGIYNTLLIYVAQAHEGLSNYTAASFYFQQYLDRMTVRDHPYVAMVLYQLAKVKVQLGHKAKALKLARESVQRYDALGLSADEIMARDARSLVEELTK